MAIRRPVFLALHSFILFTAVFSMGAGRYRTQNFIVEAPTQQIAQQVGQYAEHYRREKAKEWLGYEMPPWGRPCPLKVKVTMGGSGGATSFVFDQGQIMDQDMQIEGRLDRILASVLPHEVTHTVFAFYYRRPVPRWADEGGSVLSEDQLERSRHDKLVRNILSTRGRAMPLRRLFTLTQYPRDVMVLYAQGYSVTNFLVSRSSKPKFLTFLGDGMRRGWDVALRQHYGYQNVDQLEEAWIQHLRQTRPESPDLIARGNNDRGPSVDGSRARLRMSEEIVVRQTVPPVAPLLDAGPTVRGQSYEDDFPPRYNAPFRPASNVRPGYGGSPRRSTAAPIHHGDPRVILGPPQPVGDRPGGWNR